MEKQNFGKTSLGEAYLYTIQGVTGMKAQLTDFGARAVALFVPDKKENEVDVLLGHASADAYEADKGCFFGATVGRNANRIANAEFSIDGVVYHLEQNDNENNLHSGSKGLCNKIWEVKEWKENAITFRITEPDLEEGFPGNADVEVTYTITEENGLDIFYHAVADKKTTFNMTNHSYFNLHGELSGSIYGQELQILASNYTPASDKSIPYGEIAPVEGTPFDFRQAKPIGRDIDMENEQLTFGHGFDHNLALDKTPLPEGGKRKPELAAVAYGPETGICMEVFTDLPGVQLYTGNFIEGYEGKHGNIYKKREGFCLETQYFPNSINEPNFEASITEAGEVYETETIYRFSVK